MKGVSYMCTKSQAVDILGEVYHACKLIFSDSIKDAYLYGSYARGDFNNESDVDILVTAAIEPAELSKFRYALATLSSDLSLKHNVTVSLTVKSHDDFMIYNTTLPFYANVIKEGIRYGA